MWTLSLSLQIDNQKATIQYYEGKTRIKNLALLAPDDPVRQLDQDYQTLKMDYEQVCLEKAKSMEEMYQAKKAMKKVIIVILLLLLS